MCAATRAVLPEAGLIRFVLAPDGALTPDLAARLPGRGVWVRADRASVALARRKGAFARGLKASAPPPEDLEDRLEALLAARALATLGLGRKAGALAFGFRQVEEALRRGATFGLVEASDGARDGRERLARLAAACAGGRPPDRVALFTAQELGVALGRDHVVHACWLQERMARRWADDIRRLTGFRADPPASSPSELTARGVATAAADVSTAEQGARGAPDGDRTRSGARTRARGNIGGEAKSRDAEDGNGPGGDGPE